MVKDIRFAFRQLLKQPAFTAIAIVTVALAIGVLAAFMLTRLMSNMLYKISPHDPLAFGSAIAVITIASLVACFFPAWRAARVDPIQALREQ